MNPQRISSANRIYLCPGSVRACEPLEALKTKEPEDKPAAAMSGTKVHNGIHRLLIPGTIDDMELTAREEWVATFFANVCKTEEAKIGIPIKVLPECEVYIGEQWCGHWDRIVIFDTCTIVWEWKTGRAHQDTADSHVQGRLYIVAGMDTLQIPTPVHFHVLSAGEEQGEWHSFCVFDDAAIKNARIEADYIFDQANNPDAALHPGQVQCKYCRARGTPNCPPTFQMLQQAQAAIKADFGQDVAALDSAMDIWKQVQNYGSNMESVVRSLMDNGVAFPHWEFGRPRIQREVLDITIAHDRLAKTISDAAFLNSCSVSCPDLDNAIYKEQPKGEGIKKITRKEVPAILKDLLGDVMIEKPSKKPIKRKDDEE